MKKHLFIDNFRGFTNSYVPLVDVNFLVGQNSTGKTSLLGLLKLFSNPRLFMGPEFGGEQTDFGHFNEMVSAHAKDRSYFRIGLVDEQAVGKKSATLTTGMLLTYKEQSGMPQISDLTYSSGAREWHLKFRDGKVSYKSQDLRGAVTTESIVSSVMPQWVTAQATEETGWRNLALPEGFRDAPLFVIFSLAAQKSAKNEALPFFMPQFGAPLVWVAPIRTKPRRTYDEFQTPFSSEGSHTPYVIKRMLASKPDANKFKDFMQRVGDASGLFQSIQIRRFGKGSSAPFEVDAVLDDKPLNLSTVGYGVSQSLPIFVELLDRPSGAWFAIQQPEVHLHPRAQAALGDVFFEMAVRDKKRFLVETHSDFAIDRFRMNYRNSEVRKKPTSQVLFFERRNSRNEVTSLPIGPNGELPPDQPDSYRDFFVKEEMRLLSL